MAKKSKIKSVMKKIAGIESSDSTEFEYGYNKNAGVISSSGGGKTVYIYEPKKCHQGNVKIFKDPKSPLVVYGGGSNRGAVLYNEWINFDLADNYPAVVTVSGIKMPRLEQSIDDPSIRIEWRDGSVPFLTKANWVAIVGDLREVANTTKYHNMLVSCMGGHGRTGTALSILVALMNDEIEPIKFIREIYCDECVETTKQVEYIQKITGLKLNDKPRGFGSTTLTSPYPGLTSGGYYPPLGSTGGDMKGGMPPSDVFCEVCGKPVKYTICTGCNRTPRNCSCVLNV